jgi:hypothetical protein
MKSFKAGILAIILAIGALAFSNAQKNSDRKAISYYWFNLSSPAVYQDLTTVASEQSRTGCDGTSPLCENGYNQSQLVDPGDPSKGVKSGQTPAMQIFHH